MQPDGHTRIYTTLTDATVDEPEAIPFSAIWSPHNRDPALMNLLTLATQMGRTKPKFDSR